MIQIVAFGHLYGPLLTQTIVEICYDQWSGHGRKTMFIMSVLIGKDASLVSAKVKFEKGHM